jgi:hypothetical protein
MQCTDREEGQRSILLVTPLLPVSCSSDGRSATSSQVVSRDGAIAPSCGSDSQAARGWGQARRENERTRLLSVNL